MIPTLLAYAVVVISFPLNWYMAWWLNHLRRERPDNGVLRAGTLTSTTVALVVTVFAIVFLNNGMESPILDLPTTQLITRTAILALSIPPLFWLWIYRNGHE